MLLDEVGQIFKTAFDLSVTVVEPRVHFGKLLISPDISLPVLLAHDSFLARKINQNHIGYFHANAGFPDYYSAPSEADLNLATYQTVYLERLKASDWTLLCYLSFERRRLRSVAFQLNQHGEDRDTPVYLRPAHLRRPSIIKGRESEQFPWGQWFSNDDNHDDRPWYFGIQFDTPPRLRAIW